MSEYYYDFKTDVWVFADREGFGNWIADLQHARSADEPIHVRAIPSDSPGMRCAIMPASRYSTRKAVLKILERIVFWRELPTMQVVLCGNKRGYARLVALARRAMLATGGPLDHWHIDDAVDDWIAKRSVSLNLRGAVQGWATEDLGVFAEEVRTGGDHRLPGNIGWLKYDPEYSYDYLPTDICELVHIPRIQCRY